MEVRRRPHIAASVTPWLISLGIGVGAAWITFGAPVLLGTALFWDGPHGIVGQSAADMLTSLSSYDYFVRDRWRWPVLRVEGLGGPEGTNIAFTDGVPLLALAGRAVYRATGAVPQLFGVWLAACFALAALAATALVRQMGARTLAAAIAAAVIGVSMPALLARWGHITLMAQGLIPLTIVAYLRVVSRPVLPARTALILMFVLCLVALLTFPYLFFMVTAIAVAGLGQAGLNGIYSMRQSAGCLAVLAGGLGLTMLATGHLSGGGFADQGFGVYSMNLISPVVPQVSGLFSFARGMVDATGGQYEGFVYLGAGLLLLVFLAAPALRREVPGYARRHPLFGLVVIGSVALALSNEIYAGQYHLLSIPLPETVQGLTGIVRSSGRLAWIALYVLAGLAVVTISRWRGGAAVLALACALQWADASALRELIQASVSAPASTIDAQAWSSALPHVQRVMIDPPFLCISADANRDGLRFAAAEIQLKAAQAGVPINSVYAARTRPDCSTPAPIAGTLLVVMDDRATPQNIACAAGRLLRVCSDTVAPETLQALAATTSLPGATDGP